MSNFYTLLTRVGAALHANAQVNQTTVPWTHMRLGDGNGAAVVPTENQTDLVRQVHTLQITDISVHPDNPNWVIAEAVVPSDVGGWTVREAAIYGGADGNTCIAVGNYPETYKPVLAEGAGREMVMRMVVEISSVATVKLQIDPAVAIASRAWVESLVATPAKAGLVKLASLAEHLAGEVGNKAATPNGVKAMLDRVRGMPLFFRDVHFGDRASLIRVFGGMATPNDGGEISALTHPELVKGILRGDQATCSDTEWLNDPYKRGMWSRGTAYLDEQGRPQGWVRMPDLNQAKEGSLPPPFARGGADAKAGVIGKDTMRDLTGTITGVGLSTSLHYAAVGTGVLEVIGSTTETSHPGGTSPVGKNLRFRASAGLPEGHAGAEFAPWHIYGVSYSITSNGVMNEAGVDAEQVMGEVLLNRGRIAALENETWAYEDKTAVRTFGATYTNGSKKRKVACGQHVNIAVGNRITLRIIIDGHSIGTPTYGSASSNASGSLGTTGAVMFDVPPFKTYSVVATIDGSATPNSFYWSEADVVS